MTRMIAVTGMLKERSDGTFELSMTERQNDKITSAIFLEHLQI